MTTRSAIDKLLPRLLRGRLKAPASLLLLLCALLVGAGSLSTAHAAPAASPEYQVKAAFLYNFMKFVDWPSDGLNSATTISLGILGRDPFEDALEEVKGCDLLFICASEKGRLSQILKFTQNYRMLTVADQDGFCEAGGMINLVFVKNRVGFEVNVAAASRARLRISSQLLKLARSVTEERP